MIPVKGYKGQKVAVLGLGRSGLATAAALRAGGAEPLLWDDSPEARGKAEAEGFTLTDLSRNSGKYTGTHQAPPRMHACTRSTAATGALW